MEYENLQQVRYDHPLWFNGDTMRFFNSVVESDLIGGKYFVTSEKFNEKQPRLFTVREASKNRIRSIDGFQSHASLNSALGAIDDLT